MDSWAEPCYRGRADITNITAVGPATAARARLGQEARVKASDRRFTHAGTHRIGMNGAFPAVRWESIWALAVVCPSNRPQAAQARMSQQGY